MLTLMCWLSDADETTLAVTTVLDASAFLASLCALLLACRRAGELTLGHVAGIVLASLIWPVTWTYIAGSRN